MSIPVGLPKLLSTEPCRPISIIVNRKLTCYINYSNHNLYTQFAKLILTIIFCLHRTTVADWMYYLRKTQTLDHIGTILTEVWLSSYKPWAQIDMDAIGTYVSANVEISRTRYQSIAATPVCTSYINSAQHAGQKVYRIGTVLTYYDVLTYLCTYGLDRTALDWAESTTKTTKKAERVTETIS